jgi:hypothetical protein
MRIFISWSGNSSKKIAEELNVWLPRVIQAIKPYFSPSDIDKGARWNTEISKELQNCNFGLIVLTKENLEKPWIMYEAGSLAKQLDTGHVCPILFGVDAVEVKGPLVQFQSTKFEADDIRALLKTINSQCGEVKLSDDALAESFDVWWPKLQRKITEVLNQNSGEAKQTERNERDMIVEILELTRSLTTKEQNLSATAMFENDGAFQLLHFELQSLVVDLAKHFDKVDSSLEVARDIRALAKLTDDICRTYISDKFIRSATRKEMNAVVKRMSEICDYLFAARTTTPPADA